MSDNILPRYVQNRIEWRNDEEYIRDLDKFTEEDRKVELLWR